MSPTSVFSLSPWPSSDPLPNLYPLSFSFLPDEAYLPLRQINCFSFLTASHAQSLYYQKFLTNPIVVLIYVFLKTENTALLYTSNTSVPLLFTLATLLLSITSSILYLYSGWVLFLFSIHFWTQMYFNSVFGCYFTICFFKLLETLGCNCVYSGYEPNKSCFLTKVLKNLGV